MIINNMKRKENICVQPKLSYTLREKEIEKMM